jgi:two-component system, NarL family, sensor kinase
LGQYRVVALLSWRFYVFQQPKPSFQECAFTFCEFKKPQFCFEYFPLFVYCYWGYMLKKMAESSDQIVLGTILIIILCGFIILNLVLYYFKRQKHFRQQRQMEAEFNQTLLQSQLEIQEQTLKNISQEIHDNIGQALSLAKLNLTTMPIEEGHPLFTKITDSGNLVAKAITDLRNLSHSLHGNMVAQKGLTECIRQELKLIENTGYYKTAFLTEGVSFRLNEQKELILFRMVQELLNNILKHAAANEITITAKYGATQFVLSVADNGKGFDNQLFNAEKATGLGLTNIHNRAAMIGAKCEIASSKEKGTIVYISVTEKGENTV